MCGIAGILGISPELARPIAVRMQQALLHRGPDDQGVAVIRDGAASDNPVTLVHTRLAIVELSSLGHQPMTDKPENGPPNYLTFNGEIYNFRTLAAELEVHRLPWRSRSDSEVILNAYRAWGEQSVDRFEGMFAWGLVDTSRAAVWLCRDRLGIKPLYIFEPAQGGLLFASEVRALLAAHEFVERRLDRTALESYLAQGAVVGEQSIVQGIRLLPAGESLLVGLDGKRLRSRRYWNVSFGTPRGAEVEGNEQPLPPVTVNPTRAALVSNLNLALRHSISQMLFADRPVGLLLSSGVDSSAIATIASEVSATRLRSICVGFDVPEFDETVGAQRVAAALGLEHSTVRLDASSVLEGLEAVIAAVDQPTVDGFNTYYASRAVRDAGVTVALSGIGGDELFGGYASFKQIPLAMRLADVARLTHARAPLADVLELVASSALPWGGGRALLKTSKLLSRTMDLTGCYFLRRELFLSEERRMLQRLPEGADDIAGIPSACLRELRSSHADRAPLDRIAFLETSAYMRHMLLRDSDVFSMAQPVELRLPLLEHSVVEQAARARADWRRPDPRPKPLLVDAAGPRLPS
ncbi:MAG TPA: asparagine synthase (glutamine-hydrolyzing), partial [Polyangiaceae bacterium]|nr:asparagine synthase (glutamine-hydrolyzing) [Polyangiaceae bacterium]